MNEFPVTQYEVNSAIMRCFLIEKLLFEKEVDDKFCECTRKHMDYSEYLEEYEVIKQRRGFT